MKISKQTTAALRKRRQALLRQLPPLKAVLRGSLIERYKRCGKPGCKCADGPGHGPKYYLSVSFPGLRPQMDYVPQESYAQASEFLANYHHARQILEEICEINRELPAPPPGALRHGHERSAASPPRADRSGTGRRAPRQYARQLARPRPQLDRRRRGGQG